MSMTVTILADWRANHDTDFAVDGTRWYLLIARVTARVRTLKGPCIKMNEVSYKQKPRVLSLIQVIPDCMNRFS